MSDKKHIELLRKQLKLFNKTIEIQDKQINDLIIRISTIENSFDQLVINNQSCRLLNFYKSYGGRLSSRLKTELLSNNAPVIH